jgi:hypothetical protein
MPSKFPSPAAVTENCVSHVDITVNMTLNLGRNAHSVVLIAPHVPRDQQTEQSVRFGVFVHSFNPEVICIPLIVLANCAPW